MPLHDWSKLPEWDGVHHMWITLLFHDIKAKLPPGYRAGIATIPSLTVGGPALHPDVNVQRQPHPVPGSDLDLSPDSLSGFETEVAVLSLDLSKMVRVTRGSELVAIVELISPRNKDRPSSRDATVNRLVGYLALGVHVTFVDVHSQPLNVSLADAIANELDFPQPSCRAPQAIAYRVGNAPDSGRSLAIRRAPLTVGEPLPSIPLSLSQTQHVSVDLESTYSNATSDYLSWVPNLNGTS